MAGRLYLGTHDFTGATLNGGLNASVADGTSFATWTASNTQANQSVLHNLQLGTSGNVMGLLIQGTGGTTGGAAGTGKTHLTLWADVAAANKKLISFGSETSFTERMYINDSGGIIASTNQGAGAWNLTSTSSGAGGFASLFDVTLNIPNGNNNNWTNIFSINMGTGSRTVTGVAIALANAPTSANLIAATSAHETFKVTLSRTEANGSTLTDTNGSAGVFQRTNITSHASSNYTISSPTFSITQVATQTSGTLLVSGPVLKVVAPASSAFFTGDVLQLVNNVTTNLAFTGTGNLCLGVGSAGATAANGVFCLGNGATAPTTSVDRVQLYAVDISAGNASLGLYTEKAVVVETVTSDATLTVKINGTDYKICLKS